LAETEKETPLEILTAGFTYVRMRRENYSAKELGTWSKRFEEWLRKGVDVYAYCKHEDAGKAPAYAHALLQRKDD
jgi:uncharacterized protein YecE (DUF72 family)